MVIDALDRFEVARLRAADDKRKRAIHTLYMISAKVPGMKAVITEAVRAELARRSKT